MHVGQVEVGNLNLSALLDVVAAGAGWDHQLQGSQSTLVQKRHDPVLAAGVAQPVRALSPSTERAAGRPTGIAEARATQSRDCLGAALRSTSAIAEFRAVVTKDLWWPDVRSGILKRRSGQRQPELRTAANRRL